MKNKWMLLGTLAVLILAGCTWPPYGVDLTGDAPGNYEPNSKVWPQNRYAIRYTYNGGQCNGAFLSSIVILTAAHCLEDLPYPGLDTKIEIEYFSLSGERKTMVSPLREYYLAPPLDRFSYKGSMSRDLALLVLDTPRSVVNPYKDLPILAIPTVKQFDSIPVGGSVAIHSVHHLSEGEDYQYTTRKAPYSPPASFGTDYPLGHNFFTEVRPNTRHGDFGGVYIAYFYNDKGQLGPYALGALSAADISTRTSIYLDWLQAMISVASIRRPSEILLPKS